MSQLTSPAWRTSSSPRTGPPQSKTVVLLAALWLAIFFASLFAPPLLDDADATHASAARSMALTGDWVTLHVDGVRYLEKAPLPYWLAALSFRIFGFNTFAAHLPQAIAVLLLALLGFRWAAGSFNRRTALYTSLGVLTSAGVFLFTRIFIPEVLLSLLLCTALYGFLQSLGAATDVVPPPRPSRPASTLTEEESEAPAFFPPRQYLHPYAMWVSLALAVLTKGLVALVFFFGAAFAFLVLTGDLRRWRLLRPFSGLALFLIIAAPWHILAGLRNTGGAGGHGFFWFYFVNEHVLRFLGRRLPRDYNKLPGTLFWSLHLVWLFPWSLFLPLAFKDLLATRKVLSAIGRTRVSSRLSRLAIFSSLTTGAQRTSLLLTLYSSLVLVFFSISTNQEYYTFPTYLPLLLLIAAALSRAEQTFSADPTARRLITFAHISLTVIGLAVAIALVSGLWQSRHLAFVPDIGDLLAHRSVGNYTLSMSHFFDLTGPSFAALRLPSILAAIAFALGPVAAWLLRQQRRHTASTVTIALTSAVFLVAAHIALVRFGPMLSSQDFADRIEELEDDHAILPGAEVLLYGDQAYGSSIPFYLGRTVKLVDGRSSSILFGATFPDAPSIFLTPAGLLAQWGHGVRKILFVPLEKRSEVDELLPGSRKFLLEETSGKALYTDRPLEPIRASPPPTYPPPNVSVSP